MSFPSPLKKSPKIRDTNTEYWFSFRCTMVRYTVLAQENNPDGDHYSNCESFRIYLYAPTLLVYYLPQYYDSNICWGIVYILQLHQTLIFIKLTLIPERIWILPKIYLWISSRKSVGQVVYKFWIFRVWKSQCWIQF